MQERFELFTSSISQIYRCIQKLKNAGMAELGLQGKHTMCIYYLSRHGEGLTSAELCALCEEDKAAVSRTLAELEERGYVSCPTPDGKKKYRTKVFLTPSGKAVSQRIDEVVEAAVRQGGAGLTEGQRQDFYCTLVSIAENLRKFSTEGGSPSDALAQ